MTAPLLGGDLFEGGREGGWGWWDVHWQTKRHLQLVAGCVAASGGIVSEAAQYLESISACILNSIYSRWGHFVLCGRAVGWLVAGVVVVGALEKVWIRVLISFWSFSCSAGRDCGESEKLLMIISMISSGITRG
jgi:hypothetical protein